MCVDNFYSDPDRIREFALAQEFVSSKSGEWPGVRTKDLNLIDEKFFNLFCDKLFSLFVNLKHTQIKYQIKTNFQIVSSMSPDPASPKNSGWIHVDQGTVFAGVIFLTPDIDLNCGTSIFKLVDKDKLDHSNTKVDFYKNKIDNQYDDRITKHRDAYVETIRFNNIYNRLVCFDSESSHGANSFYSSTELRLTQVFFVRKLVMDELSPISRHQQYL